MTQTKSASGVLLPAANASAPAMRSPCTIQCEVTIVVEDHRPDDHAIRAAVLASGVSLVSASAGTLDAKRGVVTGVMLDRAHALTLRYAPK